jgi:hypothetical protein
MCSFGISSLFRSLLRFLLRQRWFATLRKTTSGAGTSVAIIVHPQGQIISSSKVGMNLLVALDALNPTTPLKNETNRGKKDPQHKVPTNPKQQGLDCHHSLEVKSSSYFRNFAIDD